MRRQGELRCGRPYRRLYPCACLSSGHRRSRRSATATSCKWSPACAWSALHAAHRRHLRRQHQLRRQLRHQSRCLSLSKRHKRSSGSATPWWRSSWRSFAALKTGTEYVDSVTPLATILSSHTTLLVGAGRAGPAAGPAASGGARHDGCQASPRSRGSLGTHHGAVWFHFVHCFPLAALRSHI